MWNGVRPGLARALGTRAADAGPRARTLHLAAERALRGRERGNHSRSASVCKYTGGAWAVATAAVGCTEPARGAQSAIPPAGAAAGAAGPGSGTKRASSDAHACRIAQQAQRGTCWCFPIAPRAPCPAACARTCAVRTARACGWHKRVKKPAAGQGPLLVAPATASTATTRTAALRMPRTQPIARPYSTRMPRMHAGESAGQKSRRSMPLCPSCLLRAGLRGSLLATAIHETPRIRSTLPEAGPHLPAARDPCPRSFCRRIVPAKFRRQSPRGTALRIAARTVHRATLLA